MTDATIITISDDTEFDLEHDEYRTYIVAECDDSGDPVGVTRRFDNEGAASYYARGIAHGREVHWD